MLSAPCYPAWQIFAGKSTEIFAVPFIPHSLRQDQSESGGITAAAIQIQRP